MSASGFFLTVMGVLLVAVIVVLLLAVVFGVSIYNRLVSRQARIRNAFAQIEVQLTRRYDLIPNLVETAKKYLQHENDTLLKVISARNEAVTSLREASAHPGSAASMGLLNQAETRLEQGLGGLRVQLEAYPELKGNTILMQLNEELSSTENRVAFARQAFNDAVMSYNVQRNTFPANIIASLFGHREDAAQLQFGNAEEIRTAPKIAF